MPNSIRHSAGSQSNPNGHPKTDSRRKLAPLGDLDAARVVVRVARTRQAPEKPDAGRLGPEWGEAALLAQDDGDKGLADFLKVRQQADPSRAEVIRRALDAARAEPPGDDEPDEPEAAPYRLKILGAQELARTEFRIEWRIRRVLVADQPCVVAAPKKGMKTSTMIDMGVSLATGTPFLGHFEVPGPVPVLMLSGEAGGFVTKDTVARACRSRGIDDIGTLEGHFFVGFDLPKLSVAEQLAELARVIRENGIKVVIIDPLYLCLISGAQTGRRLDPANLFDMGPLFLEITRACLDAGATPILVHHFKRSGVEPYELPELDSVAYAGIQEFARQWILLGRRKKFDPGSGHHELWLSVGGSAGHSGEWALDIDEGVMDDEFRGRTWNVSIRPASEARNVDRETGQAAKVDRQAEAIRARDEARNRQRQKDATAAIEKLRKLGRATTKAWREALGWSGDKIGTARAYLVEAGLIRSCKVPVKAGKGTREEDGWEPIPEDTDVPALLPFGGPLDA